MGKDPVCGMAVDESPGALSATAKGTTYYFCSEACKLEFLAPEQEMRKTRRLVALGAVLSVPILVLTYLPLLPANYLNYVLLLLAVPVQFVAGARFYRGAWHSLKARVSNMDLLIAIGTSAAFAYSAVETFAPAVFGVTGVYFDTAAVIITLVLLGRLLEHMTKGRASDSIRKLMELLPGTAHVVSEGSTKDVPVEQVMVGDLFEVRPGERVPTDGLVTLGATAVDESLVTGESRPAEKMVGSKVIGGSINGTGRIIAKAAAVGQDTVLGQITKLVEEARAGKAPIQKLADRVAGYFVPAVVAIAILASVLWLLVGRVPVATSLLIFVSVAIIACPCALGIATPAALLVGTGNAARRGILMKGGDAIEAAARVDTVVLDKTGTITEGKQSVISTLARDKGSVLSFAASLESASEHTLAAAIVGEARSRNIRLSAVENFQSVPGMGVSGIVGGTKVLVGRRDYAGFPSQWEFDEQIPALLAQGNTVVYVSAGGVKGAIAVGDAVKADAGEAVKAFGDLGISVLMLTGDDEKTALAVANQVGISQVRARLLPGEKEMVVAELQRQGRRVAMVGDGVNDAPALAKADLGIAIGSGTDIAKETGGVVLIGNRLMGAVGAIRVGRATLAKIKQNLLWAFGYNAVLIPVAAGALIPFYGIGVYSFLPFLAGVAMASSSASVVANSLLLARMKL